MERRCAEHKGRGGAGDSGVRTAEECRNEWLSFVNIQIWVEEGEDLRGENPQVI